MDLKDVKYMHLAMACHTWCSLFDCLQHWTTMRLITSMRSHVVTQNYITHFWELMLYEDVCSIP